MKVILNILSNIAKLFLGVFELVMAALALLVTFAVFCFACFLAAIKGQNFRYTFTRTIKEIIKYNL